jgi:hypothetical protein
VITEDDLRGLNQRAVLRTLDLIRRATGLLFLVAGLLAAAWLWTTLRTQGVIEADADQSFTPVFSGQDLSLQERLDFFATTMNQLAFAGALAGVALGVRAYCTVATLNAGGTLTGWNLGDPIDPDGDPIELDRT